MVIANVKKRSVRGEGREVMVFNSSWGWSVCINTPNIRIPSINKLYFNIAARFIFCIG